MSGFTLVFFIGGLVAIFLLVVALLMWQEAKARGQDLGVVYVLQDAVEFVSASLTEPGRLRRSDVQRILEWELHYLQGLAQKRRSNPVETFAGGGTEVVQYLHRQIAERNGVTYDPEDIAEVLRIEALYLASIGAVGEQVAEEQEADQP